MPSHRILDYVASAARSLARPTLLVRIENEGGSFLVDDLLPQLDDDARAALKADHMAVVEFPDDMKLEWTFDAIRNLQKDGALLQMRLDAIPGSGRPSAWSSKGW